MIRYHLVIFVIKLNILYHTAQIVDVKRTITPRVENLNGTVVWRLRMNKK